MCHDLLRRSPRLTICSPLFFKVQSFIIIIALPLPLTFLRFNFFTTIQFLRFHFLTFLRFSFYVSFFYESFLRSFFFLRIIFILFNFFTNHFYDQLFYEQFLRSNFSGQSYRTQGPAADTILTFLRPATRTRCIPWFSPHLPLGCSLATRTRCIPWFSPPFTPEMLLCRQSQCDSACGLGSSLTLLYRHVPSS